MTIVYVLLWIVAFVLSSILLVLILYVHLRLKLRREHVRWLLRSLSLAFAQNLPLMLVFRAAARDERGIFKRRMERIAGQLADGDSLSAAIRIAMPVVPGELIGAINGAERANTLPTIVRRLARREMERTAATGGSTGYLIFWGGAMLACQLIFAIAFGVILLPKFNDILSDFKVDLPQFTRFVFGLFGAFNSPPIALLIAMSIFLFVAQFLFGRYSFMRQPDRFALLPRITDTLAWFSPFRSAAACIALSRQIPLMQASIEAGYDLPAAARHAACVDANWHARKRLHRFADVIESGMDPAAAARCVGMPAAFVMALQKGRTSGDLGAALEFLARYYESLVVHWERVLASIVAPLVIAITGAMTLCLLLAVLLPVIRLVEKTCDSVY